MRFDLCRESCANSSYGGTVFTNRHDLVVDRLNLMREGGPQKLKIVSDFDYTITKFRVNGSRGASCFKVLEDCGLLGADYQLHAQALQNKYYPLETDPTLTPEQRSQHMVDWYAQANGLLVQCRLTRQTMLLATSNAVNNRSVQLRDNAVEFFEFLDQRNIPTLIFSAGILEILEHILVLSIGKVPLCAHIVSNQSIFTKSNQNASSEVSIQTESYDKEGEVLSGFAQPNIHAHNKTSAWFKHTSFFQIPDEAARTHVILIGDNISDVTMSDGMEYSPDAILKIGYLNDKIDERLPQYLELFDIVVIGDASFTTPLRIVQSLCN